MTESGLTNSRLSFLPKRSASTRKQQLLSLGSWINGRSSFNIMLQTPSTPNQGCHRCPHCHQPLSDTGEPSSAEAHSTSDHVRQKISMQEALMTVPYSHAREEVQPPRVKPVSNSKASLPSIRGLSFLPFRKKAPRMDIWGRKFSRAPGRPIHLPQSNVHPSKNTLLAMED